MRGLVRKMDTPVRLLYAVATRDGQECATYGSPIPARSASEWIAFDLLGEIRSLALRADITSLRDAG